MKSKKVVKSISININNAGQAPTSTTQAKNNHPYLETFIKVFGALLIHLLK
jgi:hypothetical protein